MTKLPPSQLLDLFGHGAATLMALSGRIFQFQFTDQALFKLALLLTGYRLAVGETIRLLLKQMEPCGRGEETLRVKLVMALLLTGQALYKLVL